MVRKKDRQPRLHRNSPRAAGHGALDLAPVAATPSVAAEEEEERNTYGYAFVLGEDVPSVRHATESLSRLFTTVADAGCVDELSWDVAPSQADAALLFLYARRAPACAEAAWVAFGHAIAALGYHAEEVEVNELDEQTGEEFVSDVLEILVIGDPAARRLGTVCLVTNATPPGAPR